MTNEEKGRLIVQRANEIKDKAREMLAQAERLAAFGELLERGVNPKDIQSYRVVGPRGARCRARSTWITHRDGTQQLLRDYDMKRWHGGSDA